MAVPAGGPATIYGILYQMLWCLLQAAKVHVEEFARIPETSIPDRARLVLEPEGGGGDIQQGPRVVQLKAKTDEGPWSLQEVIAKVLPDLYRAVDLARDERTYGL